MRGAAEILNAETKRLFWMGFDWGTKEGAGKVGRLVSSQMRGAQLDGYRLGAAARKSASEVVATMVNGLGQ